MLAGHPEFTEDADSGLRRVDSDPYHVFITGYNRYQAKSKVIGERYKRTNKKSYLGNALNEGFRI